MLEETVIINKDAMLPVGTLLQGGKFRIDRYLSSGGFGNTYVAVNTEFNELVAIKEFFMQGVSERDENSLSVSVSNKTNVEQFTNQKEKFRKEARRLRKLRNEHIVAVHDLFEENGTVYYEMDLIKGESLSERLKRTGQPLSEADVRSILEQVLNALSVVHAQGIYHLDLKPANIMVDQQGCALLIDFGASKQMSASDGESVSTSSALAYTPGYAPLEQTEQNIKAFGPWTDLYALGATLYKLLTNQTPPSASEILMNPRALYYPIPVSAPMQQLIAWMMKPRIDERPQIVTEVKGFLAREILIGTSEESTRIGLENTVVVKLQNNSLSFKAKDDKPPKNLKDKQEPKSNEGKFKWGVFSILLCAFVGVCFLFVFIFINLNKVPHVHETQVPVSLEQPIKPTSTKSDVDDRPSNNSTPSKVQQNTQSSTYRTNSSSSIRRQNNQTTPRKSSQNTPSQGIGKVNTSAGNPGTAGGSADKPTPPKPTTTSTNNEGFNPNLGDW